jgi:hypothetical protein
MMAPIYERAGDLLEADVGDEILALDAEAGECYAFNDVATSIWRHLVEPASIESLREKLLDEYDVSPDQCERDLLTFLEALGRRKLVRVRQT